MTCDADERAILDHGQPAAAGDRSDYDQGRRYDRFARLVGESSLGLLSGSHVMVIGLGGVGSFAAESLVRSGLGRVSLVDFDKVSLANVNRQLQAMEGNIGRLKVDALAERLRRVNPAVTLETQADFYSDRTSERLLSTRPDFVVDAIDNITAKCHLLATCRARGIPVVSSLGAAGRLDPALIAMADLARAKRDPMGRVIRKILRQKYDFPRTGSYGITAVYSTELAREPEPVTYDPRIAAGLVPPEEINPHHSADKRRVIYGTASFVTGTFGLFCASVVVRALIAAHRSIALAEGRT
jgi:tRNA A37 threonylcarbamoyladenosine dehydratase